MNYWIVVAVIVLAYIAYTPVKQWFSDFGEWYLYYIGTAIVEKERFESDPRLQRLLKNLPLREEEHSNGKVYLGILYGELYVKPPIL